ncbi:MAG: PIG-L deacetylase family protein [Nanoarchaeota archaeon]
MVTQRGNVVVICAHSDDEIFGPGGTLAKYAREGRKVYSIIFSYGASTHPHFKTDVIIRIRQQEAEQADKIIQGSGVFFLGLSEGKFEKEFADKEAELVALIKRLHPTDIFTHSRDDTHQDHRAVHRLAVRTYDSMKLKADMYTFDIWNVTRWHRRDMPRLVVDVSQTFTVKMRALRCFKSQINLTSYVVLNNVLYVKTAISAVWCGLRHKFRFAEVFYKVR